MTDRTLREAEQVIEQAWKSAKGSKSRLRSKSPKGQSARVAYLGPSFSHSHEAALDVFPNATHLPYSDFRSIFRAVADGQAEFGVIPVKNSIGGWVFEPLHELFSWADKNVPIMACADYPKRIRNFLAAKELIPENLLDKKIRKIYTKDEAYRQCVEWLQSHRLDKIVEFDSSTSRAAQRVKDGSETDVAAICSETAVREIGLVRLTNGPITDDPTNTTRFLIIKTGEPDRESVLTPKLRSMATLEYTTLLFVVLRPQKKTLYNTLGLFADRFNLREIALAPLKHSMRPSNEFEDWFLLEFDAWHKDELFEKAVHSLKEAHAELQFVVKVAGSFRRSRTLVPV